MIVEGNPFRQSPESGKIPDELKARPQWVVWQGIPNGNGKTDKIPHNPLTGWRASSTDPATWSSFERAVQAFQTGDWAGIGFMFSVDDPYSGVDLDSCFDPDTESLEPWADALVSRLDSYSEVSPSGRGVKIIVRGSLPDDPRRKRHGRRRGLVEMYGAERFFTLTGRRLWWPSARIELRETELSEVYWQVFERGATVEPAATHGGVRPLLADAEVVNRAAHARNGQKFAALWAGDTSGHGDDDSAADLALCSILAFWLGPDPVRIDQLFRQSGLYRAKWERADYRERTIGRALERSDYWEPKETTPRLIWSEHEAGGAEPDQAREFAWTDYGNAERLVAYAGHDLRYCDLWGKWLVWDGRRWLPDDTQTAVRLAKETVRTIYREASTVEDDEKRKKLVRFATASESASRIKAILELAKSEPGIPVTPDDLDGDGWFLTVSNGTVDLRSGALVRHRRDHYSTKLVPVSYDPQATCPTFLAFLDSIMDGNQELIGFLRRAVGYSLTGNTREQVAFICHGTGSNGKSTFLDVLQDVLGDYAMQTPTETLMLKRNEGIPNDIARLRGARLVAASETAEGRRLSESLLKQLTGGDRITARFMRAEWFEFKPMFKLWLVTNHKPVIKGTDRAIWRRIRLIPFTVTIPDAEQDKQLPLKLRRELPGILRWAVEGCLEWQAHGLGLPQEIRQATDTYRQEMDVLAAWINDCCEVANYCHSTAKALYGSYSTWCEEGGERAMSQRSFALQLAERGFESIRTKFARSWVGIQVRGGQNG